MQKQERHPGRGPGRLSVVSLGPGFTAYLVPEALSTLKQAQVVIGYVTYIDLIRPLLSHQEVVATGMKAEVQRCRLAIDRGLAGEQVALVSSGDAGIYGMAGLALEMCAARGLKIGPPQGSQEVDLFFEVIPGVPAMTAAAALLGAPLMHDFAAISLSDLLTPWEIIETRLKSAIHADLVLVLYNPQSKKRDWQLGAVHRLLLGHRDPKTPVGLVSRAMRQGQQVTLTTLAHLLQHPVDMQTIIIVGNSRTYTYGSYMITPRGYLDKYQLT